MATSRRTAHDSTPVSLRRRGPVLEHAILDAALEQLASVGWTGLTMEGVAARAQTGKAAVYRRWSSKGDLVADALRAGLPEVTEPPDQGCLRADLIELCGRMREAMYSRSGHALRAVLDECDRTEAERFVELILGGVVEPGKRLMAEVVRRGIERGEVRADATGELLVDVLPAMMMYRHKMTGADLREHDLLEVIDQVMLPLLSPRSG
ncbi:TetR/AcrR family transcriptional regulator [Streptomyces sp. H27-D2]|uniref:TetR/AcrR family transcriptional regulator n=1 Tax=Streptomyces sp. H27-D2 TaxID=3046304 RepID=UPI002DBD90A2|nr:TetR/AcrR family transcriptional regulator [Streptomyces sp. H27-D2]MEC4015857.1 TetR/AcrR family transcriptional regulator [Streptomyces sp. H27-D2]